MQLRMLARRARAPSMTVLGDLAQATGPASPGSWEETLAHLGRPANAETGRADDGLPASGRGPRRSPTGCSPRRARRRAVALGARRRRPTRPASTSSADELVEQVAAHAVDLVEGARDGRGDRDARRASPSSKPRSKRAAWCSPNRARSSPIARSSSFPRRSRKGLEFDGVIVVEPAEIAASGPHGVRLLFVALTRAVQHLAIAAQPRSATRAARAAGVDAACDDRHTRVRRFDAPYGRRLAIDEDPAPRLRISRRSGKVRVVADPGVPVSVDGGTLDTNADGSLEIHATREVDARGAMPDRERPHDQHRVGRDRGARRSRFGQGHDEERQPRDRASVGDRRARRVGQGRGRRVLRGECHVVFVSGKVHIGEAGQGRGRDGVGRTSTPRRSTTPRSRR